MIQIKLPVLLTYVFFLVILPGCSSTGPKIPELQEIANVLVRLQTDWNHPLGGSTSYSFSMDIQQNEVCSANSTGELKCLSIENGKSTRIFKLDTPLSGGVGSSSRYFFVGTTKGSLLAITKDAGVVKWEGYLNSEILGVPRSYGSKVFVKTGDGSIFALGVDSGEILWRHETDQPALILRSNSSVVIDESGDVLVGSANGRMALIDGTSGTIKWEAVVGQVSGTNELERMSDIAGDPIIDDEKACAVSLNGNVGCFERKSGNRIWFRTASSVRSVGVGSSELVYVDTSGEIIALEKNTGSSIWTQNGLMKRDISSPLVLNDFVLVGDSEGYVHVMSLVDGAFIGRKFLDESGFSAAPLAIREKIIMKSNKGRLFAISLEQG